MCKRCKCMYHKRFLVNKSKCPICGEIVIYRAWIIEGGVKWA